MISPEREQLFSLCCEVTVSLQKILVLIIVHLSLESGSAYPAAIALYLIALSAREDFLYAMLSDVSTTYLSRHG